LRSGGESRQGDGIVAERDRTSQFRTAPARVI